MGVRILADFAALFAVLGILVFLSTWNKYINNWVEYNSINRRKIVWFLFIASLMCLIVSELIGTPPCSSPLNIGL